jgi:hypothetical protein
VAGRAAHHLGRAQPCRPGVALDRQERMRPQLEVHQRAREVGNDRARRHDGARPRRTKARIEARS